MNFDVEWSGIAQFRSMNASRIRAATKPILITGPGSAKPIAALVPYDLYLQWQETIEAHQVIRKQANS